MRGLESITSGFEINSEEELDLVKHDESICNNTSTRYPTLSACDTCSEMFPVFHEQEQEVDLSLPVNEELSRDWNAPGQSKVLNTDMMMTNVDPGELHGDQLCNSAQNARRREERADEHGEGESNANYKTHWFHSISVGFSDIINSFIPCENKPEEQLTDPMSNNLVPTKGSHCDKKKDDLSVFHGNHSFEKCSNMFEIQLTETQLAEAHLPETHLREAQLTATQLAEAHLPENTSQRGTSHTDTAQRHTTYRDAAHKDTAHRDTAE